MWDPAFDFINGLAGRNDLVDAVAKVTAERLGIAIFVVGGIGAIYYLRRDPVDQATRSVVPIGAVLLLTFLFSRVLRAMALWERPFQEADVNQLIGHATGVSFPSNHATAAFATAFAIGAFLSRRFGAVLAVLALISGMSRVFVGVHWSHDIWGAAVLALSSTVFVWYVMRWVELRERTWHGVET